MTRTKRSGSGWWLAAGLVLWGGCGGPAADDAGLRDVPAADVRDASVADAPDVIDGGLDAPLDARAPLMPVDCTSALDCLAYPVCFEDPACAPLGDARDGEPCTENRDCAGGSCARSGDTGFCLSLCDGDEDCFGGSCVSEACLVVCDADADCPAGTVCDAALGDRLGLPVCVPSGYTPSCGNGVVERLSDAFEVCDGDDVPSCREVGQSRGTVTCSATCQIDASGCESICGDGEETGLEQCDGEVLGCVEYGFTGGTARCTDGCELDLSGCTSVCGDGMIAPDEACDGPPADDACGAAGFRHGSASCDATCQLDVSGCFAVCGDGDRETGEECDDDVTCRSLGYADDRPWCTEDCRDSGVVCAAVCGNDVREPGEGCDGTDIRETCADFGVFGIGEVACVACEPTIGTCRRPPPPPGWTCGEDAYHDGDCDCGCGIRDPSCPSGLAAECAQCPTGSCAPAGCSGIGASYNHGCVTAVPSSWSCAPTRWADGACDCGCGARDADCPTYTIESCERCEACLSEGGSCATQVDPRNIAACL